MTRWRLVWEFDWNREDEPDRACFQIAYQQPPSTASGTPHRFAFGKPLDGPTLGDVRLEKAEGGDGGGA